MAFSVFRNFGDRESATPSPSADKKRRMAPKCLEPQLQGASPDPIASILTTVLSQIKQLHTAEGTDFHKDKILASLQTGPQFTMTKKTLEKQELLKELEPANNSLELHTKYAKMHERAISRHLTPFNTMTHGESNVTIEEFIGVSYYKPHNCPKYHGKTYGADRTGPGTLTWSDGTVFEGRFVSDFKVGDGTYKYPDGCTFTGRHKKEGKDGEWVYSYYDGTTEKFVYSNNVIQHNAADRKKFLMSMMSETNLQDCTHKIDELITQLSYFKDHHGDRIQILHINWTHEDVKFSARLTLDHSTQYVAASFAYRNGTGRYTAYTPAIFLDSSIAKDACALFNNTPPPRTL